MFHKAGELWEVSCVYQQARSGEAGLSPVPPGEASGKPEQRLCVSCMATRGRLVPADWPRLLLSVHSASEHFHLLWLLATINSNDCYY